MTPGELAGGGLALGVSSLFLVIVLIVVWWLDRHERGPLHWVGGALLCGAAASPLAALLLRALPETVARSATAPVIGLVLVPAGEEVLKALGLGLVVMLTVRLDSPTDGLVYGTAAGLGFAVAELAVHGVADAGLAGGALAVIGGRHALGAAVHGLSSSAFGGMLGIAGLSKRIGGRLAWAGLGTIVAIAFRVGWGATVERYAAVGESRALLPWMMMLTGLCAAFAALLVLFVVAESRIIKAQLGEEVSLGVLPAWVGEVIPYYRRRVRSDWWPRRQERTVISRLLTRLAFRKQALRGLPAGEVGLAGLEVVRLRQRLRLMLDFRPARTD